MIVEAGRRGVAREVMVIAAAMSIQDPRERPAEERETADALHARFADPSSDFLSYLNLWEYLRDAQRRLSGNAFRRTVRAEHLHYLRIREWQDLVAQLRSMARSVGIEVNASSARTGSTDGDRARSDRATSPADDGARVPQGAAGTLRLEWDADRIHVSLLAGLLSQVGQLEVTDVGKATRGAPSSADRRRKQRSEYRGARGARFAIWPGSALARKPPTWVMAAGSSRPHDCGRDVAAIKPEWEMVRRAPDAQRPAVLVDQAGRRDGYESVLLLGLPIVTRRRILLGRVDLAAREMFGGTPRRGRWTTHHRFFHDNKALVARPSGPGARPPPRPRGRRTRSSSSTTSG